ncbi:MAG: alpha/beta hydrolase [Anaerolineaceae bacterium]|jgi:pimeloyl-ACP methyl ester carboxylesterase|nr:alpha/beta hydrolase [Anaerolineaceae bacterium]
MPFANGLYSSIFDDGTLSQPPILLLHGAGSTRLCWPSAVRRLPGYKVIALDLPGHGRSEGVALQSVAEYAEAVLDFMREMGLYRASLVGHSLGSAIALYLALHYPDRVAHLGIISGGAALHIPENILAAFSNRTTFKEGLEQLAQVLFGPSASNKLKEQVLETLQSMRPGVLYGDWLACANFDLSDSLQQIKIPAWIIVGDHDKLTPPYQSRHLAKQIKNSTLQLVPGAGHMLILEAPDAVSRGLAEFLKK